MTHALPLRPQRSFVLGLTFHALLPPSQSRDEFLKRHGDGRSRYSISAAEGRLLEIDEDLAEQYGLVWQSIDRTAHSVAETLDQAVVLSVDNLEQFIAAASLAPAGSSVSKSARTRQDSILLALCQVIGELEMLLRENSTPSDDEVGQLIYSRFEHALGVTDPLVMELGHLTDSALFHDAGQMLPTPVDAALSASDSGLFRVAQTGIEPVIKRVPASSGYGRDTEQQTIRDEESTGSPAAPQYLA